MTVPHTLVVFAVLGSLLVCGRADLCAPGCSDGSDYFPHPQNCNNFYQCAYGTALLQYCPAGLEFSSTSLRCDYPAQAGCTADPLKECGIAAPSDLPGSTAAAPTTPDSSPYAPTTAPAPTCAPKCPWHNAYLPHPQDCSKFYICGGTVAYETRCQEGLLYDMKLMRCEYPENAFCRASPERACDEHLKVEGLDV